MNALESRAGRRLRLRPWLLLVGAAVIVAAALYFVTGSSPSPHAGSPSAANGSSHSSSSSSSEPFGGELGPRGDDPRTRRAGRGTEHHDLGHVLGPGLAALGDPPTLSPDIGGKWVQTSPTTLSYALDSPLIPSSQEVVTIPGGIHRGARHQRGDLGHVAHGGVRRRRRRHPAAAAAAGRAQLPPGRLHRDRPGAGPGRPGPGPDRDVLLALGRPAHRSSRRSGPRARRT